MDQAIESLIASLREDVKGGELSMPTTFLRLLNIIESQQKYIGLLREEIEKVQKKQDNQNSAS